jgi:signal transduction histidine kinase/DNA-binding response OmpR family regulator
MSVSNVRHIVRYVGIIFFLSVLWVMVLFPGMQPNLLYGEVGGYKYFKNYTQKDYGWSPQNWAVVQDKRGFIYVGNQGGLLEYDGAYWRVIKIPHWTARSLTKDRNGTIFVGGNNELGFLAPNETGLLEYRSLIGYLSEEDRNFGTVWSVHAAKDGVYFRASRILLRWNSINKTFNKWKPEKYFNRSFIIDGKLFVHQRQIGLTVITDKGKLKLVSGGEHLAKLSIYMGVPLHQNGKNLLIGTSEDGLFTFDGNNLKPFNTEANEYLKKNIIYHGIHLSSSPGHFAVATKRGGVVFLDSKGKVIQIFNSFFGLQSDNVKYVFEDSGGNLWLAMDRGVSKIEYSSPFSIFDFRTGVRGLVLSVVRHRERIFVGTTYGLFDQEVNGEFKAVSGIKENCFSFLSIEDYLLAATTRGVFRIDGDEIQVILNEAAYTLYRSKTNPSRVWVGAKAGLVSLHSKDGKWYEEYIFKNIKSEIRSIVEGKQGHLWLGTLNRGTLNLRFKKIGDISDVEIIHYREKDRQLPTGEIHVAWAADHVVFCTAKGLYRFDEKRRRFEPDMLLGDEFSNGTRNVFRLVEDQNKTLWFHSKLRNFKAVLQSDATYKIHKRTFFRIPTASVNGIYPDGDTVWFAGNDGLIRYDKRVVKNTAHDFSTHIREVGTIDGKTNFFYGYDVVPEPGTDSGPLVPVIEYKNRNIRLKFSTPFYEDEKQTEYRSFLEGYNEEWSGWSKDAKSDYTNLGSGIYTFHVESRNIYGEMGKKDIFRIRVLPPWYKTWWAFLAYFFLLFFLMFLIVKLRSMRLQKEKQHLETVVQERTEEVQQKNRQLIEQSDKLKEMDRVKSRFFANISHEFRTPLTLIMGPLEQMMTEEQEERTDGNNRKKSYRVMLRNSQRLLTLINQLLDLSRFDSGKMKLLTAKRDIVLFIKGIIANMALLVQQNKLSIKFDAPGENVVLYFDSRKMEEAMYNVLINAVKFTPNGGEIGVAVTKGVRVDDRQENEFVRISIRDNGPGIPQDQLVHIFDRFYQAGTGGEKKHNGTGIGLALTKEVVALHHGRINVHSRTGEKSGTEFVILLPIGCSHLKPEEIADNSDLRGESVKSGENRLNHMLWECETGDMAETGGADEKKEEMEQTEADKEEKQVILVVEDHADVRAYIRGPLESRYTVMEAKDGREGVKIAKEIMPDLIISDIMMPEMDGYELCRILKNEIETSHIPIILLTAKASEESMVEGLETGADDYITKPFNTTLLTVRIKNLIELRRQLQLKIQRHKMLLPAEIKVSSLDETFLKELHQVVEKNLSDPDFNIDLLCEKLLMGRTTMFKKVHALTGETPNQFIQSYRLERAVQLLKANFGNVTEVAFEVGFSSSAYFTKCFKEKFHQLPSTFLAYET